MVDREIVNIPLRNFAGHCEKSFRQAGRQNLTKPSCAGISASLMQRQLLGPIARGASVPESIAREYANLLLERRRGSIGVVPAAALRAGIEPTAAEVASFYQQRPGRFTIPERRVIRYALIGPEQVAATAQATDQEIATFYQQNGATYGPRETRNLQHIVLPDQTAAQRFAQRLRSGTAFAEAAREAGFSPTDINIANQTREQYRHHDFGPKVAAAYSLRRRAPSRSDPQPTRFISPGSKQIVRTPARPMESVRAEIATAIEQRKQVDGLAHWLPWSRNVSPKREHRRGRSSESPHPGSPLRITARARFGPAIAAPAELQHCCEAP